MQDFFIDIVLQCNDINDKIIMTFLKKDTYKNGYKVTSFIQYRVIFSVGSTDGSAVGKLCVIFFIQTKAFPPSSRRPRSPLLASKVYWPSAGSEHYSKRPH